MSLQYLSDENGQIIAVQVPIKEWEQIKNKYPDIIQTGHQLPQWHQNLIDSRFDNIKNNPDRLRPISELMDELDK